MQQVQLIPLGQIHAMSNMRLSNGFDKEGLTQLAESIKTHGLIQPIVVRHATESDEEGADGNPPYVVIAGRRRIAAAKLAGMAEIPALVSANDEEASYQVEIAEKPMKTGPFGPASYAQGRAHAPRRQSAGQTRSNTAAMPWPPPMHIVTSA